MYSFTYEPYVIYIHTYRYINIYKYTYIYVYRYIHIYIYLYTYKTLNTSTFQDGDLFERYTEEMVPVAGYLGSEVTHTLSLSYTHTHTLSLLHTHTHSP